MDWRRTHQSIAGLLQPCLLQALLFSKCFQANYPELWLQDAPTPARVTEPRVWHKGGASAVPQCQTLPGGHWHTLVTARVRDYPKATWGCLKPGGIQAGIPVGCTGIPTLALRVHSKAPSHKYGMDGGGWGWGGVRTHK